MRDDQVRIKSAETVQKAAVILDLYGYDTVAQMAQIAATEIANGTVNTMADVDWAGPREEHR